MNEITDELEDAGNPVRLREEVGDLLFSCVNLARRLDVDAESACGRPTENSRSASAAWNRYLIPRGSSCLPSRWIKWIACGNR